MTTKPGVPDLVRRGDWTLWLPLPPKPLNRSTNGWRAYHFPRKRWLVEAGMRVMNQLGADLPKCQKLAVGVTLYVVKEHDPDNAASYLKPIYDLLKRGKGGLGIVPDDTGKHIVPQGFPKQVVVSAIRRKKAESAGDFLKRQMLHKARYGVKLTLTRLV